jgi:hypothetical protein
MVSDSDTGMEGGGTEEESQETPVNEVASYAEEEHGAEPSTTEAPTGEPATTTKTSRSGGRRAALKIIRQHVESVSKDLAGFRKSHEASSKRLEKQVATLRNDLDALKSYLAKENAKARSKEEAAFARVLAKLNLPKPRAKKAAAPKKKAAKPKSKGKK